MDIWVGGAWVSVLVSSNSSRKRDHGSSFCLYLQVERDLLSPYVSPRTTPFRHILLGSGSSTLQDVLNQLTAIKEGSVNADSDLLKSQFVLATWTIQSCANALVGNVWDMDNEI